jgi:hypothetical protein
VVRNTSIILLALALVVATHDASAQKQLIILKKEKVVLRLYPGDEFVYSLKSSPREVRRSYVNNVFDTAVQAHDEVVAFHKIERVYFQQRTFWDDAGPKLVVAGVVLFLADQLNTVVVQNEDASIDEGVLITSVALTGAGVAMILFKKKYQNIGGKYKLRMVDEDSPFYQPDLRHDISGGN